MNCSIISYFAASMRVSYRGYAISGSLICLLQKRQHFTAKRRILNLIFAKNTDLNHNSIHDSELLTYTIVIDIVSATHMVRYVVI